MLRWTVKDSYYRDKFVPRSTTTIPRENLELDHYAFKYLSTELDTYKIMDTNFVDYIEQRGNVLRMKNILIPTEV